jgi:hypothetical protein
MRPFGFSPRWHMTRQPVRSSKLETKDVQSFHMLERATQFYRIYQSNGQQVGRQIDQTVGTYQKSATRTSFREIPSLSLHPSRLTVWLFSQPPWPMTCAQRIRSSLFGLGNLDCFFGRIMVVIIYFSKVLKSN